MGSAILDFVAAHPGAEFEIGHPAGVLSPAEESKRLHDRYWRPMRRDMLTIGIDGQTYVRERAKFRKLWMRSMELYFPPIIIRVKSEADHG